MAIFIDSGNITEIQKYLKMGILRGVTTNPSILLKDGVKGGMAGIQKRTIEIAQMIRPLPFSVEVTSNDKEEMVRQAREFAGWADNIVVKVTIHGPHGELDNLEVIHLLETKHNIRVNVTAMMSAQQCFLAAMAGATYVSLFCGRVNNMGYNSVEEIRKARQLIDQFGLKAKIICASTREVLNVVEWLAAGSHIVTVLPKFLEDMIVHPYSKETVQQFLRDAQKVEGMLVERVAAPVLAIGGVKSTRPLEPINEAAH
jgi:transaldolase